MTSALKERLLRQLHEIAESDAPVSVRERAVSEIHLLLGGGTYDAASAAIDDLKDEIRQTAPDQSKRTR